MSKIAWDQTGHHLYETGTDRCVVYPADTNGNYPKGYGWNGVTGYTESPSGADETALYADNIKYLSLRAAEEFGATITAYTYPDEFAILDGSAQPISGVKVYQQARKSFGLCIRTLIGNDLDGNDHGYLLHLVYGLTASPSERNFSTVNDSPEAIEFSWELSSVPVAVNNYKNTSVITIDSTKVNSEKLAALEAILYGTDGAVEYAEITDVTYDSYSAVTPEGTENPTTEGWYERSGEEGSYVYTLSVDTTVDNEKTYYSKTPGSNPQQLGWYERSGSAEPYTYNPSTDATANASKTYYSRNETGGTDPRLPLPDEVIKIMSPSTGG